MMPRPMASKDASGRHAMFPMLSLFVDDGEASLSEVLKALIAAHLTLLKEEFQRYFPDLDTTTFALVRNPFTADVNQCVPDDEDAAQEERITLATNSGAKDLFQHVSLSQFWCGVMQSYPRICDIVLSPLNLFVRKHIFDNAHYKIKGSQLQLEPDTRCCLSSTQPIIARLFGDKQFQPSH